MPQYPNTIASKLPTVGTSIFTIMSKLASDCNAINLSQGFPDFSCSSDLVKLINDKIIKLGSLSYIVDMWIY